MSMLLALLLLAQGTPTVGGTRSLRPPPPPPPELPPNVLLIVVDDLGVDQVGCYAQNYATLELQPCTPNIDALAASGMRFTNAWSNSVCSPSRAALQTGRPSFRTGVGTITGDPNLPSFNFGLQLDQPTLPKLLEPYSSASIGKWHLSDLLFESQDIQHPIELGFDTFSGSLYNLDVAYNDWTKTIYPEDLTFPHYFAYATVDTTEDALVRIDSLPEPWFTLVSYNAAHVPLHCPATLGYPTGSAPAGSCDIDWCADCETLLNMPPFVSMFSDVVQSRALAQSVDAEIGRLLAAVDPAETVVVLLSDNGSTLRSVAPPFPSQHAKGTVFQGGVNVPLIVRAPGGLTGDCHELVGVTDVYATVADLAEIPMAPDEQRDSVSLTQYVDPAHVLSGATPREHVYAEFFGPNFVPEPDGTPPPEYVALWHYQAVRNATHKLVHMRDWDPQLSACEDQLHFYELASAPPQDPAFGPDPHEQVDLMLDPPSWSPETTASFEQLLGLLETTYPELPVGQCD
jgi:arylsulfatase A-like enzyme